MKTQYPIEKDSNTHYSHTSNSKDVLNRILEFQTNGDYVGFKQYFEPILKNQSKQHPENFKTAIIFALNQQDPKSAEYFLNQYVDYYSFDQDEMLLEIARLYAIEGNGTEAYLRLQTLVAMESRLSPKAKELIPQVAPKEFLFEKHQ